MRWSESEKRERERERGGGVVSGRESGLEKERGGEREVLQ